MDRAEPQGRRATSHSERDTMRLLILTNNAKSASFRQRVGIHLDLLRNRGIDSTVAVFPASLWERRKLLASAKDAHGVFLHRKVLNGLDALGLRHSARRVIYDFDDAVMYSDRRPQRDSRIRYCRFTRAVALSHMVLAGNEYLAEHARRCSANVHILPTGLDLRPYHIPAERTGDKPVRLVWIGSRSTLKYLHEIRPVLDRLGTRFPDLVLRIVCNEFFDLDTMKVEKREWSKETEAEDLITSDIGLAPIPDDRFTRGKCGFKILQYQAAGLPVIASPVGVNARYVHDGTTGFLARDPAEWLDKLATLVQNAGLRKTMGQRGRRDVEEFDARIIGERFCELIMACLGRHDD